MLTNVEVTVEPLLPLATIQMALIDYIVKNYPPKESEMKYVLLFLSVFATFAFAFDLGGDKTYNTAAQTNLQAVGVDVSNRITNDSRSAAASFAAGGQAFAAGGLPYPVSVRVASAKLSLEVPTQMSTSTSPRLKTPRRSSQATSTLLRLAWGLLLWVVLAWGLVSALARLGRTTSAASAKPAAASAAWE